MGRAWRKFNKVGRVEMFDLLLTGFVLSGLRKKEIRPCSVWLEEADEETGELKIVLEAPLPIVRALIEKWHRKGRPHASE